MSSSRLFWKLVLVYAGLNLTLAVGFLIVVTTWQRTQVNEQVEQRLHDTAVVLRSYVEQHLKVVGDTSANQERKNRTRNELQLLVKQLSADTKTRLTLIDGNGDVLADSDRDPSEMLNHNNRTELIDARTHEQGTAIRPSPTLGIDMFYLALPIRLDGETVGFVRVAMELRTINQRVAAIRWLLWLFALVVGLFAIGLTSVVVGRIIRPLTHLTRGAQAIAAGKDEDPVPVESKDEVGLLAIAFNDMQRQLELRVGQLRENNDRLATVLGSLAEGIMAVDADENILFANDASRRLLGCAAVDVVGRPLLEVARSRPLNDAVLQSLQTGRSVENEFETVGESPRRLSLRVTCLPGDPWPGVVVTLHDVTELRRLENLRHELVANVSHELKTPLAAITAYAETLRLGAVNDSEHNLGFVSRIEEQAERLHQLILDMLQIARVESGKEVFDITEVPIADVVNTCAAHYANKADLKNIDFRIEPPAESLIVRVDEEGLRTILENLIDNAIKYTPEQGNVTVRWRNENSAAILEVEDTGLGIAQRDQARVFERFFRVDKARSRELGGTGLGLSIVKHLSQAFGGGVALTSELGKGSTFQIRLPL